MHDGLERDEEGRQGGKGSRINNISREKQNKKKKRFEVESVKKQGRVCPKQAESADRREGANHSLSGSQATLIYDERRWRRECEAFQIPQVYKRK